MSKRHHKGARRLLSEESGKFEADPAKLDHNFVLEIVIGSSNVTRWNQFKITFSCTTNEEFASFLLDLAQSYANENPGKHTSPAEEKQKQTEKCNKNFVPDVSIKSENENENKRVTRKVRSKRKKSKTKENAEPNLHKNTNSEMNLIQSPPLCTDTYNNEISLPEPQFNNTVKSDDIEISYAPLKAEQSDGVEQNLNEEVKQKDKVRKHRKKHQDDSLKLEKQKKQATGYDIRKAPELNEQVKPELQSFNSNEEPKEVCNQRVAIKIKLCCTCGTRHVQDLCPLQTPHYIVKDSVTFQEWEHKFKPLNVKQEHKLDSDEKLNESDNNFSFAFLSVPNILYINESNVTEGLSVFTHTNIQEFTQFGPLVGKVVKEVDIPEDFNMKYLWETYCGKVNIYMNTEDANESNWMRFVKPAPTREERNLASISKDGQLFLITVKDILPREELLYWQDDVVNVGKKKMEKTTCGGCNMTFAHPLYYRTHCSIFHDIRYSLTIRKYHCKVCGVAVLGKENIMKHAAELHNGQGAYQCQFCKKFFLRLNYLEMHRTYGCSANPHRSRPLCDFCGRKFCQPQKLKVHIKRMHSDLSEVLKEFQCKNCLKLLGSRAALQRHMKEVHNKQVNGACACVRCGKLFQNKSNLKIHMLTHSGIKPFKCAEGSCHAAFTTKQCLQFHYKKVHGFAEEQMPKIERSVDYTFEAYSGDRDQESLRERATESNSDTNFMCLNDGSDDENSIDEKNLDDPPALHSPVPVTTEHSASNPSPPTLEPYTTSTMKILSKGSKKWLGEEPLPTLKPDMYQLDNSHSSKMENSDLTLDVDESQTYERAKLSLNLNAYNRHESSNASLLVEAALDSVSDIHCSEPSINIDVDSTTHGTEALVNNLCTLAHPDTLSDVPYSHSVDIGESRDINLISPSVNEPISVTDGENMGIDYSNFHHNDFSPTPTNSPGIQHRPSFNREYIDVSQVSPHDVQNYNSQSKPVSPSSSPPRYSFGHSVSAENISSDDSNGMAAQNLSLHGSKTETQLDLSIYKAPYNLEAASFQLRKDFGMKLSLEPERKQVYVLEIGDKMYHENGLSEENNLQSESSDRDHVENFDSGMCSKDFDNIDADDIKHKNSDLVTSLRMKYHDADSISADLRNKQFEIDLNLRTKGYDITNDAMRGRTTYEGAVDSDFRVKGYDPIEGLESRNNLESEFRIDRNFEPLILSSTELQGLDMSARSYHNYHSSATVQNLNRYHHLYPDVERPSVDLRLNYSPPLPPYTHSDVLRVVSLDLTSPGRHSVDLSLRSNPLHVHQLGNTRLLSEHGIQTNRILTDNRLSLDQTRLLSSDQTRLLGSDLTPNRHLSSNPRLLSVSEIGNRILSDHSTNRLLSNEQLPSNHLLSSEQSRLISDESRLLPDQPRLLDQGRLLTEGRILPTVAGNGSVSPIPYGSYSVSPTPYHPTALTSRSHTSSPTPSPYHHYTSYY